jgi:hypothetical protein
MTPKSLPVSDAAGPSSGSETGLSAPGRPTETTSARESVSPQYDRLGDGTDRPRRATLAPPDRDRCWSPILVVVAAGVVVGLSVLPYNPPAAISPGALTPEQAEAGTPILVAKDPPTPVCSRVPPPSTSSRRVPQLGVVLLFHGYTSCPNQFCRARAPAGAAGYRVLVPALARARRWPTADAEPRPVDPQQLADFAMGTTAIAFGIDKRTVVGGLSAGATLALWAAEHNAGVQRVVAPRIPFLRLRWPVPPALAPCAGNVMRFLPNSTPGGTSRSVDADPVPRYSYPKFATRSDGRPDECQLHPRAPPAPAPTSSTSSTPPTTRSTRRRPGARRPATRRGDRVTTYEFPASPWRAAPSTSTQDVPAQQDRRRPSRPSSTCSPSGRRSLSRRAEDRLTASV